MKRIVLILGLPLCATGLVFGQMPGMQSHPSQPDDTRNASAATNPSGVRGQQSFDEMMVCFFNVAFPAQLSAKEVLPLSTPTASVAQKAKQ
jgi:hypothetical protein